MVKWIVGVMCAVALAGCAVTHSSSAVTSQNRFTQSEISIQTVPAPPPLMPAVPAAAAMKFCPIGQEVHPATMTYCPLHGALLRDEPIEPPTLENPAGK